MAFEPLAGLLFQCKKGDCSAHVKLHIHQFENGAVFLHLYANNLPRAKNA